MHALAKRGLVLFGVIAAGGCSPVVPEAGENPPADKDSPAAEEDLDEPEQDAPDADLAETETPSDQETLENTDEGGDPDQAAEAEEVPETDGDGEKEAPPHGLTVAPDPIDLGKVLLFKEGSVEFSLMNNVALGGEAVKVVTVELLKDSDPDLRLDPACLPPFDLEPQAGQACRLLCQPSKPGLHEGGLRAAGLTRAGRVEEARVAIQCRTILPVLYVDPNPLEFGAVPFGKTAYRHLAVGNAGSAPLTIQSLGVQQPGGFSVALEPAFGVALPVAFDPGDGVLVEVGFSPAEDRQVIARLVIGSDDPQVPSLTVVLSGRAGAACPGGQNLQGNSCVADNGCLPFTTRCVEDPAAAEVCAADGAGFGLPAPCAEGQRCLGGACRWAQCEAPIQACQGGARVDCASGGVFGTGTACQDQDLCTLDLCHPREGCLFPDDKRRCDDGNLCTDNQCQSPDGGCFNPYNTIACDPHDRCLEQAACRSGRCVGAPKNCDDHNPCTRKSCDPLKGCQYEPLDGPPCADGNACTKTDHCVAGVCRGTAFACDDANACTDDSCEATLGCQFKPKSSGCDDGNPCTVNDNCASGVCAGVPLVLQKTFCGGQQVCDPAHGLVTPDPNPFRCDDGLACTTDACRETEIPCAAPPCSDVQKHCLFTPDNGLCDSHNPCGSDLCVPGVGCLFQPLSDLTACDLLPGVKGACMGGVCSARCSTDLDCLGEGIDCTFDSCDRTLGFCRHQPVDAACTGGTFCSGGRTCDPLKGCVNGPPPACADPFPCTDDLCDEGPRSCRHVPHNERCEDYNDCTVDLCRAGEGCVHLPRTGACDDHDPCTVGDFCSAGVCQPGATPFACDDGNPCTDDSCRSGLGCEHRFNNAACDDHDPCTAFDQCNSGVCVGVAKDCDDGHFCNGAETCGPTGCQAGRPVVCEDGVDCTDKTCRDDTRQCEFTPNDSKCDDHNPCTATFTCTAQGCKTTRKADGTVCGKTARGDSECRDGVCAARCTENAQCDDGVPCTTDACDQAGGFCTHLPLDSLCDTGKFCDGEFVCHVTLGCRLVKPVNCDDGIGCTIDSCDNGLRKCLHTAVNSYCDDGNPCTTHGCSPTAGCVSTPAEGSCSTGDPCLTGGTCVLGRCEGTAVVCPQTNPCAVNTCVSGTGCTAKPVQDGAPCAGGPGQNVCIGGQCVTGCATGADCADGVACTIDACNPQTHQCQNTPSDAVCDDGLFCNGPETCNAVTGCQPGTPVVCSSAVACVKKFCDETLKGCQTVFDDRVCEDGNVCTTDVCTAGGCQYTNNNLPCDDHDACTVNDHCGGGTCSGSARDCDDQNACTKDWCVPTVGCVHEDTGAACMSANQCQVAYCDPAKGCALRDRQGPCDDGDPCTLGDACAGDVCKPGIETRECDGHDPCQTYTCDPQFGCQHSPKAEGESCVVGAAPNEACHNGQCVPACTADADCFDNQPCTTDHCNTVAGRCEYGLNDALCADTLFCNGAERCLPFVGCVRGTLPDCSDGIACTVDACDEVNHCTHAPADALCDDGNVCTTDVCTAGGCQYTNNSRPCDDGDRCTGPDACVNGVCQGLPLTCDDQNPCTAPDACDPVLGCVNPPANAGADCGVNGICLAGGCAETCAKDADCGDPVYCTADFCDPALGRCRHVPLDARCDDGLFCNGTETCHPAFGCQAGVPLACDDHIDCTRDSCDETAKACRHDPLDARCDDAQACTDDACDPLNGCSHAPNANACDDGNGCTGGDHCVNGVCRGGNVVTCLGVSGCKQWFCDPRAGCQGLPVSGTVCDDQNACTVTSHCFGGECLSTLDLVCATGNPCSADSCDTVGGCSHQPRDGQPCDDQSACTAGDSCHTSTCAGAAVNCDDGNPCTADSCNTKAGCLHLAIEDGTVCTLAAGGAGQCRGGGCGKACTGVAACDDGVACTADTCVSGFCQNLPDDNQCPARNFCDGLSRCDRALGCVIDPVPNCNSYVACVVDSCDPIAQDCQHVPANSLCNDGNPCTNDVCSPQFGCLHEALDGPPCDDGNACTFGTRCVNGLCAPAGQSACDHSNPCVGTACNPRTGACDAVNLDGLLCNDGRRCTLNDRCQGGRCAGTSDPCDDGNPCTYDRCAEEGGCEHIPLTGAACASPDPCFTSGVCLQGTCTGDAPAACADTDPCTHDWCLGGTGCKHDPIAGCPAR